MSQMSKKEISAIIDKMLEAKPAPVPTDMRSVLELLAMTMFADKQVLASEIKSFVEVVLRLQNENVLTTDFTEKSIIQWYENNKQKLSDYIRHDRFENWIDENAKALTDFPAKHQLLRAMDEIAMADGERHISEKAFEVLTTHKWTDVLMARYSGQQLA